MKKIYLISLLCLFAFTLAFSKCGCGDPSCGGCSTQSSSCQGQDWRSCRDNCDCTQMGFCCHDYTCDVPKDAFVKKEKAVDSTTESTIVNNKKNVASDIVKNEPKGD